MKNFKLSTLVTLFAMTLFIFACGEQGANNEADAETTSQTEEGNNQPETATAETPAETVDKTGKEYTSAFVCEMHCKGSGSEEAGKCPVCGMNYVASADLDSDDEGEGDHEGHDHE